MRNHTVSNIRRQSINCINTNFLSIPIWTLNLLDKHGNYAVNEWCKLIFKIEDYRYKGLKQSRMCPQIAALKNWDYLVHDGIEIVKEKVIASILDHFCKAVSTLTLSIFISSLSK